MTGWVSTPCNVRIFYVEALHAAAIRKQTVVLLTDKEGVFKVKLLRRVFRQLGSRRDVSYTHYSSVYKTKNYYIILRVEEQSITVLGICFERWEMHWQQCKWILLLSSVERRPEHYLFGTECYHVSSALISAGMPL
jgi:hypothetical protein